MATFSVRSPKKIGNADNFFNKKVLDLPLQILEHPNRCNVLVEEGLPTPPYVKNIGSSIFCCKVIPYTNKTTDRTKTPQKSRFFGQMGPKICKENFQKKKLPLKHRKKVFLKLFEQFFFFFFLEKNFFFGRNLSNSDFFSYIFVSERL